ncbi:MAG: DUF262 domain-containing protein [Arenimonas sp.]
MDSKQRKVVDRFSSSQNALVLQQSDLSLQSVSDMVDEHAIDISPKYQRRERWDKGKESELIESFLLNIPVPPIYLAEDEYGTYSVIDGKQRVTAINRFLRNELRLTGLKKFPEVEGLFFSDLPVPIASALRIRPYLRVVTILRQSDSDLKHEVFLRLNKAGVALNSQEIRNVAFRGGFNDLIFDLSQLDYFSKQLKATPSSKVFREMIDVQYVLRFFTVRQFWNHFPGNMDVAMDQFMSEHHRASTEALDSFRQSFIDSLEFCETVWGNTGFMKPGASRRVLQGFYDIQMVCSSLLDENARQNAISKSAAVREALNNLLAEDTAFSDSVSQFTSNPANVKYRIGVFTEVLQGI